jgi:hypothetical protein
VKRKVLLLLLAALITAVSAWFLMTPDVLAGLLAAARRMDPLILLLALALNGALQWLRAWRFAVLTYGRLDRPEAEQVRIALELNFFIFALPMRLGEASYPLQMRRSYGQPLLASTGVLLLSRAFDLGTLTSILLLLTVHLDLVDGLSLNTALVAGAAAAGTLPVILGTLGRTWSPSAAGLPAMARHALALSEALRTLRRRRVQAMSVVLSYAIWISYGGMAVLVASGLSPSIGVAEGMLGAAAGNLAFALPVNGIAGFGASQAAWVLAVTQAGVTWRDASVAAIGVHAVSLFSALLFGGTAVIWGTMR